MATGTLSGVPASAVAGAAVAGVTYALTGATSGHAVLLSDTGEVSDRVPQTGASGAVTGLTWPAASGDYYVRLLGPDQEQLAQAGPVAVAAAAGGGTGGGSPALLPAGVSFLADWTADPTRGGWGDRQTAASDRLVVDTSLAAPGGKPAIRCTVRPGDNPIDASGERSEVLWMRDASGATVFETPGAAPVYYAFAARFPAGWAGSLDPSAGDWAIIFQMHGPDQIVGPSPFMFQAGVPGAGQPPIYVLKSQAGDRRSVPLRQYDLSDNAVRPGVWSRFVVKLTFAKAGGEIRIWRRDENKTAWSEVLAAPGVPTLLWSSQDSPAIYSKPVLPAGAVGEHYFKQGLYRNVANRTDTYHFSGATARAESFAGAAGAAFGAAAASPDPTATANTTGTAAAMALTLTDFQPGFVAQRTAGTTGRANLGISWQASAPGDVQARVVAASGAVVVDWQTCTSQTAAGGVLPGPVPQGDDYRVQIRDGAGGAVQTGTNAWGVGVIFAFHGQSNMRGILYGGWTGQEMDLYNNSPKRARSYYYSGWSVFGHLLDFNNDSLYLFGREMVAALGGGVPVGVVPVAENSRSIEAFLPGPNGDVYYNFFAAAASGKGDGNAGYASPAWVWGGDLEGVFYHQGEADVGQTDAWYKERLGALHRQFLTQVAPYGRTGATFLFCPALIASENAQGDRNVGGLRRAVLSYVAERRAAGDAADVFSTADFATSTGDDLHFGEGDARMAMRRLVQHAKRKVGAASHGGRGPAIGSMSRSGRTVTVSVAHDGGAALRTARGGAPSGFAASNDGFASHKVPLTATLSGGTVTLALPAEFDGRAATIGHLQAVPRSATALLPTPAAYPVAGAVIDGDTRPDISNNLYDDAAIPGGVRGQADPAAPGLPLLPTFGAWTLSDGQTVSAPAGSTASGGGAGGAAPDPTPGKVTGLRVTSVSGTTIAYAWDNHVDASVYRAEMRARGGAVASTDTWGGIDTIAAPTTTGSKGGLVDGTYYELRVLARDSAGATIATSDTVPVTIGTPAAGGGSTTAPGTGTGGTTTTPATGTNTGAQVAYYTIDGKAVLDAAAGKLLVSAAAGTGGTSTGGAGTGSTGGGATTPTTPTTPATTPKVAGVGLSPVEQDGFTATWNAWTGTTPTATEYRLEGRLVGATAYDGYGITAAVAGQATYSATKRGLPAGRYQIRIVPKKGPNYPGDDILAGASDPVEIQVGAAAGTGTGGSTGTGTGTGAGGGTATYTGTIEALRLTAAVPTLPVQLRVRAEEAITNPPVCCGHGFGPGDVPAGSRVRLRTAAGAEIALQQDDETYWPDGSLKYAVLSFVAPDAFAAAQTVSYTVDAATGAPNRAASYTLSQLAANSDFRLEVKGFNWGNAVGVMRVNDVVAANKVGSWGANPKLGAEIVASGPIRQEWRFWGVARRQSDGALHESVRLELYVRRWAATGAFEVLGRQRQPNLDAAYYGSTWSTTGWSRGNAGIAECFNGTARVFAMGGPNDRDARTVGAGQFNAGEGKYNFRADQNLGQVDAANAHGIGNSWYGMGVPIGFSGDVPGGLSASAPYYLGNDGRVLSRRNDGGSGVGFSAPGGNTTVFPLVASFPGTCVIFADDQGDPYWSGSGARPRVRVGHDDAYLTRASRMFAPMDLTQPRTNEPSSGGAQWPYHPYRPNQVAGNHWWDWGLHGDDWQTDRVGWLSRQHANWLLTPFDKVRRTHCISLAYMQGDGHFDFEDQRSARVVCCNNGPDRNGAIYPELASPLPTLWITKKDDAGANSATPGFAAMAYGNTGGSGYTPRYDPIPESSHWPNWQLVPYLATGHRVHLDLMRTSTSLMAADRDAGLKHRNLKPPQVPAPRTFYTIFYDQLRGNGWMRLALSNLRHVLPDAHLERRYFDDFAEEQSTHYGAIAPYSPWKLYGQVPVGPWRDGDMADYTDGHAQYQGDANTGFHTLYETMGTLMCRYRGESGWDPAIDVYLGYLRDVADDQQYPDGSGFFTAHYGTTFRRGDGSLFPTRREWIQERAAAEMGASPPYPNSSNWAGDNRRDGYDPYTTCKYDVQQVAILALASWIAKADGTPRFPGCDRVRLQLINRLAGTPGGTSVVRYRFADANQPGNSNIQWSIVPPGL